MKTFPKSILITGASSGIGAALAYHYAKEGVHLFLGGRNEERLKAVAKKCEKKGAKVSTAIGDVLDNISLRNWIEQADKHAPLDLVIANAGISAGTGGNGESQEQAQMIFAINVYGVNNTVYPAMEIMKKRGHGQIAIISSLSGFYGFPGAPAYCASKAAVRVMGEALRADLRPHGVKINVICPGYVKTPMTDANDFPMPLMVETDKAAAIIARGLEKNKARISFPFAMRFLIWLIFNLPAFLVDRLLGNLPRKDSL